MTGQDRNAKSAEGLFEPGRNCWRVEDADRFGWCVDGESYFTALSESFERAQHEILILGWDIDSRFELLRDETDPDRSGPLCERLKRLVDRREGLCVRVLSWDFAMVYALERELMPARAFGWENSERLHFRLDGRHATGASHHQKIVVIDGAIAYSGGFDLTKCRWDTREHAPDEPRRRDPDGNVYRPFHDVQAVVTGGAAMALRELVSERWKNASGSPLPDLDRTGDAEDLWPGDVAARAEGVEVAIARTWADAGGGDTIREVEASYLDMIRAAQRSIYIENQYFTSVSISEAIASRLDDEDGPEVLILLPAETSGWLEQATMDILRNQAIARLQQADRFGRLRIVSPTDDGLEDAPITVHAKIIVVDNRVARIGSANLSRRSMGLDSECDLVVDDEQAGLALAADLLAEHLGQDEETIAESLSGSGLLATLDRYNDQARRLIPLEIDAGEIEQAVLEPVAKVADLEKPITRPEIDDSNASRASLAGGIALAVVVVLIAGWAIWAAQGSGEDLSLRSLLEKLRGLADHPLAPFAVVPAFVAGSLVVAPVTGMIALCALLFDPWIASIAALTGTLAATVVNHWLGRRFHDALMQRMPDSVTQRIDKIASSSDAWTLAGLRLIPIAPFTFVNLAVGASGISLRAFIAGTLIAMTPGIVLISLSVDRARAALAGEPVFDPWIVAGIAAAGIGVILLRLWKNSRQEDTADP